MDGNNQQENLKKTILYRLDSLAPGAVFEYGDFWLFRQGNRAGAAISTGGELPVIHVHPGQSYSLDGVDSLPGLAGNYLALTVDMAETDLNDPVKRDDFCSRMASFVQPELRGELLADPKAWARRIIEMSGDTVSDTRPYPLIAELVLVNRLRAAGLLTDVAGQYRGPDKSTHDFELPEMSLECKSRLHGDRASKAGDLVVSSELQLSRTGGKPLDVVYCPMEEIGDLSLERCVRDFGEPRAVLMGKLALAGFVEGDFAWQQAYRMLEEPRVYEIDDKFPRITPAQFPGGFPAGITKLVYHVSLRNLPYCPLDAFIKAVAAGETPVFSV